MVSVTTETHASDRPSSGGRLRWLADRTRSLPRARRLLLAFGLGALASLAMPPAYVVPVLLLAFPGLVWLNDAAPTRWQAFFTGWLFGFGYFVFGLYWISFALFVDIATFFWALPLALAGLPAILSVFVGLATLSVHWLKLEGWGRILGLAVLIALSEWLRGHLFTGFPWNLTGYAWTAVLPVLQVTSVVGIYGLSALTLMVAVIPARFGDRDHRAPGTLAAMGAGLALFAVLAAFGTVRMQAHPTEDSDAPMIRLVQPNIAQTDKWDDARQERNLRLHIDLSQAGRDDDVQYVIWPETAIVSFLSTDDALREAVAGAAPAGGQILTGAPRFDGHDADGQPIFYNSLVAIDDDARITGHFDKFHLVPFGEYLPLRSILPFDPIATGSVDFSAGPGPETLTFGNLPPVSALICYEVIFPGRVISRENRPEWMLNLTNDAWYGNTAGPHQHFAIARVRAVEEGLPLVRVANTGISGAVDPVGRVVSRIPLGESGTRDIRIPRSLSQPTPYNRFGNHIVFALFLGLSILVMVGLFIKRK